MIKRIWLRNGEIVIDEIIFNRITKENKSLKQGLQTLRTELKDELDSNNYMFAIRLIDEIFGEFDK